MIKTFSYFLTGFLVCAFITSCGPTPPANQTSIDFFREKDAKTSITIGETVTLEWKVSNLPNTPECFFNVDPEGPDANVQTKVPCKSSNEQKPAKTTKFTLQARALQEEFISKEVVITVDSGSGTTNCSFDDPASKFDACKFD